MGGGATGTGKTSKRDEEDQRRLSPREVAHFRDLGEYAAYEHLKFPGKVLAKGAEVTEKTRHIISNVANGKI